MQRSLLSLPLNFSLRNKLFNAGFRVIADLQRLTDSELIHEAGVSQQDVLELLQAVRGEGGDAWSSSTSLELLQKEGESRSIVSFCSQLDEALSGGVPVGKITEVCGTPGVGKTQLCLQVAVDVQIPPCFGGLGGHVIFVDTEGGFLLQRIEDIAAAVVRHCSLLVEDDEQREGILTFTVETILSNIYVVRCNDYIEVLAQLHLLPDFLLEHPRTCLLVIDSVACPFRHIEVVSQRTQLLQSLGLQLTNLAIRYNLAVLVTNHMTTRLQGSQSQLVPALGELWGHAPTIRLLLQWLNSQRVAIVVKSPDHMEAIVQYQITSDGLRDVDESV
ncbi:DNA repair protein RAD51 homolog 3 [Cynoglossus semilaevis]|uniref:DNA repair protein RAD51 homolog 3 n=1 Tax=Cynoglossus semilaevis TaxID=244447 RepID=A0A3P8WLX5_CYNSE|nr:DNA repair protein RAD51 homolog 3 [Cynoglossus semilaevis]